MEAPGDAAARHRAPAARLATLHGCAGSLWIIRSAGPTTGSPWAAVPRGTSAPERANDVRSAATSSRSSRRSSTTCWPGSSLTISSARSAMIGQSQLVPGRTVSGGSAVEQPATDLAVGLVGAGEQHVGAAGALAPRSHAEVHRFGQAPAVGVAQCWPGWITMSTGVAGSSDDLVGLGAADDGDVAGARGGAGRRRRAIHACAAHHGDQRQGVPRPATRSDHGGSRIERRTNAPCARGPSRNPANASIAGV